ncbi:LADA_0F10418g1_1 [Lachancea dasiensis]|uniref:LADA_0F10418g1_1 n=1 Tax=Lachancea dasiensis TaxID=1072105 RepID=A0A1G4JLM4_9SACH|nr:LADA_0F10418g1_1 [Lachancea dasiensis]
MEQKRRSYPPFNGPGTPTNADERLDSAGTAVGSQDADEFEMQTVEQSFYEDGQSDRDIDEREEWLYLKDSHKLKRFFLKFWNGPEVPEDLSPTFPQRWSLTKRLECFPDTGFRKRFPSNSIRFSFLAIYCCFWCALIYAFIHYHYVMPPTFYRDNGERVPIRTMTCQSSLFWKGKNNACGTGGSLCLPFDQDEVYVRCPALCDRGAWTYSAINVGEERVKYRGYQIGGGERNEKDDILSYPYRGDSFACGAAVHAGAISPFTGGCARVAMSGYQNTFPPKEGRYNTGMSVGFSSFFPSSFSFKQLANGYTSRCYDPRIPVLILNIAMSLPVFYLYDGVYGYWILTVAGYVTLVFFLDPPLNVDPYDNEGFYRLMSLAFQRFLPLGFVLYVLWKCSVRRTLDHGSPVTKILCWFPTFWLGVMNNITFDRLPVDRLTITDLKEQAGALLAVGSIITTIISCAVVQAYSLWKSGRFRKFLCIYLTLIAGLFILGILPGLSLRIHHYILGILLVPGCATRGTPAYLFQGILIGLVLSGVSRWDFASIVETRGALLRGEAGDSWKPPLFFHSKELPTSISWRLLNASRTETEQLNAYSLLINDIEHYVGKNTTVDLALLMKEDSSLGDWVNKSIVSGGSVNLYLRVARASQESPESQHGDYTNAAVLEWPQGIFHEPQPGVS